MKRALLLAFLLLTATACGDNNEPSTSTGPTKVTIKTSEYAYSLPSTFKGGLVEITLDNSTAKEPHEAGLVRLDPGKTLDDFRAIDQDAPPPSWTHSAGGPGPVSAGKRAVYTANLQAGTYALICFIPAPDGVDHYKKGMLAEAKVTTGTNGSLPSADATITTTEFKFEGTDALKAGSQRVRVTNPGQQLHNVAVFALAPGKKVADIGAFFSASQPAGPPPFTDLPGLLAPLPPGDEAVRTLELEKGVTYGFVCFIPDTDGAPHSVKGMVAEVTV
jgi:uncharacterized cupredoxin-like copper-binding protein